MSKQNRTSGSYITCGAACAPVAIGDHVETVFDRLVAGAKALIASARSKTIR